MAKRRVNTWPITLVICLFVVSLRLFIYQPYRVLGDSMLPAYHGGQVVIVDKLAYKTKPPQRGDVIAIRTRYGLNLKRVVGLPEEWLVFDGGNIYIGGKKLDEPYATRVKIGDERRTSYVPAAKVYAIGDNRGPMDVSRKGATYITRRGTVPYEDIIGKVVFAFK